MSGAVQPFIARDLRRPSLIDVNQGLRSMRIGINAVPSSRLRAGATGLILCVIEGLRGGGIRFLGFVREEDLAVLY